MQFVKYLLVYLRDNSDCLGEIFVKGQVKVFYIWLTPQGGRGPNEASIMLSQG